MDVLVDPPTVMDFNPRSREGSDERTLLHTMLSWGISIHAPARGATTRSGSLTGSNKDFNPRSREGSDRKTTCFCICNLLNFNPRSREGSDSVKLSVR